MSNDIAFLAEFADGKPQRSALELAAGAAQLAKQSGGAAVALAYGAGAADGAAKVGAQRAVVLGDEDRPAVTYAAAAAEAARDALVLLAPATPNGRDFAAVAMGRLNLPAFGPVSEVSLDGQTLTTKQATLQGSIVTESQPVDGAATPSVVLVLANTFTPADGESSSAEVTQAEAIAEDPLGKAKVVESHAEERAAVNLEEATVIVAGGRGVGGEQGFETLQELASALGGAVGASRAAADAGWVPYQLQIGQTGKVVKPALYLGVGISGAIQHRVGMQTAEHVVAINKDPDAPIGEFADLFVVADLFSVVPKLTEEIKRRKGS